MGEDNVGVFIAMNKRKILIAGGGTGGHLFPALAIGEEIKRREPNAIIHYIGSDFGLEAKVFPVKDVWHTLLPIRGLQRDINLTSILRNALLPFRIIKSLFKTKKLLNEFIPDIIIGTGGYASALPLYTASNIHKKIPIVLQEQNSYPGLTTRWFASNAKKICIAFKEPRLEFNSNTVLTGNPVRKGIGNGKKSNGLKEFNFSDKPTIFLFGGSQGSSYLNSIISKIVSNFSNAGIQLLWQTGDIEYSKYKSLESKNIRITPFVNNMAAAYAISNLLICRSGALTLSEITVCGKPSILIPFPYAAGDHQTKNAQSLVNAGAARILFEKSLEPHDLLHTVMNLIHNKKELKRMGIASNSLGKPNATNDIVNHILTFGEKNDF